MMQQNYKRHKLVYELSIIIPGFLWKEPQDTYYVHTKHLKHLKQSSTRIRKTVRYNKKKQNKTKERTNFRKLGFFGDHLPGSVWTDAVQKYPNSDSCGKSLRMHTTFILIILSRGIVIEILAHFTQRANCTKQKSNIS